MANYFFDTLRNDKIMKKERMRLQTEMMLQTLLAKNNQSTKSMVCMVTRIMKVEIVKEQNMVMEVMIVILV